MFHAVSALADIIPTKAKHASSIDELFGILSGFSQVNELIHLLNLDENRGLPVTTLILLLDMHGRLPHSAAILNPLEQMGKEAGNVRETSGLLLLDHYYTSEEYLCQ